MKNFECAAFELSKWDFREFAAFLRSADPEFVVPEAGSENAIDGLARSQDGPITSVHPIDGPCSTSPLIQLGSASNSTSDFAPSLADEARYVFVGQGAVHAENDV